MKKLENDCILKKHLIEALDDERRDVSKYTDMAKLACENGYEDIKGILCDIKKDEESHAKILEHILNKYT